MSTFALFLRGTARAEHEGRPVEIGTRKGLALLAYLALDAAQHSRDALASLLWPEADQARAHAALRSTLCRLKKALGECGLWVSHESVGLRRGPGFWLDVEHFRAHLAECRAHGHGEAEVCPACLGPCAERWTSTAAIPWPASACATALALTNGSAGRAKPCVRNSPGPRGGYRPAGRQRIS